MLFILPLKYGKTVEIIYTFEREEREEGVYLW
jgi:hypothetical protein